jgi:FMN reductase
VGNCDILVVDTPIYRATCTRLFQHFINFIDQDALVGTPAFLSAIGGDLSHCLSIDHQLRPLFTFFQAHPLPVGVFAENADFDGYSVTPGLQVRISAAVDHALPHIHPHSSS